MTSDPVSAPPDISVQEFVDEYLYKYHYDLFPVVRGDQLIGAVGMKELRDIPNEEWKTKTEIEPWKYNQILLFPLSIFHF